MIPSLWSVGWDSPVLVIILVASVNAFVAKPFLDPMDRRGDCSLCFYLFLLYVLSLPFGATKSTHTGQPVTTLLVFLARLKRSQHPGLLVTMSGAPFNRTFKPIVAPSRLLYQPGYQNRRSQTPSGNLVLSNRPFTGCCCLSSVIFAQLLSCHFVHNASAYLLACTST